MDLNLVNQKESGVFDRKLEEAILHCVVILVDNRGHERVLLRLCLLHWYD